MVFSTGSPIRRHVYQLVQMALFAGLLFNISPRVLAETAETPATEWQHVYPYPTGSWLAGAVWGSPGFVAVGGGEILFSTDAMQWETIILDDAKNDWFAGVCYHDGKYLAVGTQSIIASSSDGQNWNIVNKGTNGWLRACAGGGGIFVATGFDQTLLVSSNGVDWEKRTSPATFLDIAFGNGIWVASTGGSAVYTSSNLLDWTRVVTEGSFTFPNSASRSTFSFENVNGPSLSSICFGDGRFVIGGARGPDTQFGGFGTVIKTSTNGLDWESVSLAGVDTYGETRGITFGNGIFFAAQRRNFLRSTDGITWEKIIAPDADGELAGVAVADDGRLVAVGSNGAMLRSDDGMEWQLISNDPRVDMQSIEWAKGRFVATGGRPFYVGGPVGKAAVLTSTNGSDWQSSLTHLENQLSGVAFGRNLWVVTGDDGQIFNSRNGTDWIDRSLPPTTHDLHQLVYGRGRFVAFAIFRDLVYRSVNGKRWVASNSPLASEISNAKFLKNRFIGLGGDDDGLIFSSKNGVKWTKTTFTNAGRFAGAAYGKGRYVAGGRDSSAVSFDGVKWNVHSIPRGIYDLEYVDGWFVSVGPEGMMLSRDGVTWQTLDQPALPATLSILASGDGTLVSGYGSSLYRGTLQDSETFRQTLRPLWPSHFELYGEKRVRYRLERSTDLLNWKPAAGWTLGQDNYKVWTTKSFQGSNVFWRAVSKSK